MRICDKCQKHKEPLTHFIVKKQSYELCDDCLQEIVDFIKGKKKNMFGNFGFGGFDN